ncbi:hypothetical protein DPMN_109527 [Dreissena polymorpha]|uniref:Uncharacterized protein n=1 Tax=Dreissena polymorpha TaxID=45954 RepID=A0A9D4KB77_DREPO|nr:hypothetical protein DPMN_109527 [Dreissena polymorpha]
MQDVTDFMSKYWGMRNPNIVLSVISAEEQYKPWRSQRLNDDFQKGIIKVPPLISSILGTSASSR